MAWTFVSRFTGQCYIWRYLSTCFGGCRCSNNITRHCGIATAFLDLLGDPSEAKHYPLLYRSGFNLGSFNDQGDPRAGT